MRDDDDDLLARAVHGEPEAFGVFYRRYERDVLAYFMRRTRDAELAADLCAETFAAALIAARRRYRPLGEPATAWLFTIARRVLSRSLERHRAEARARRRLGVERPPLSDEARETIERLIEEDGIRAVLEQLPADQAAAVHGRVLEELTYEELAARAATSPAAVRQRVSRALSTLRTKARETE